MTQWLIYGMVYLGSALMVCNIWCFVRFARFERGEGIEKRKDDLAGEIAAMMK